MVSALLTLTVVLKEVLTLYEFGRCVKLSTYTLRDVKWCAYNPHDVKRGACTMY